MRWIKKGLIFKADDIESDFIKSTQGPTSIVVDDKIRIFFSTRVQSDLSMLSFIDVDIKNPKKFLNINTDIILDLGKPGTFDDHGITPNYIIRKDEKLFLFYTGWSKRGVVPYSLSVGIAVSDNNGISFKRIFDGPIIDRNKNEPYFVTASCIIKELNIYHMAYTSAINWVKSPNTGQYEPIYIIKYAKSDDLINWEQTNQSLINTKNEMESVSNPTIIKKGNIYHMWFCYRGPIDYRGGKESYRIGYAYSKNLLHWERDDLLGLDTSENEWESNMVEYPSVIETKYGTYMFYNGNGFGQSGFGYAILED
jgi:hypothetical protein